MPQPLPTRKLPVGAEVLPEGGVHFRVWAPRRQGVDVLLQSTAGAAAAVWPLERDAQGYFAGTVRAARAGDCYRYRLDRGESFPDPASRFQPEGPHGPSMVVDPHSFRWSDDRWPGVERDGQVLYEMHIGTFTSEGTWGAAALQLAELARIGITVLEVMPVADFPGRFGWGYDGVDLFAPTRLYGLPDDFRRFVDRAHAAGLGVILDVVYNHLGPSGNYLKQFADAYFTDRYPNEWGEAINFDGPGCGPVREFFIANAGYWIDEYHLDGLRLDATQQIFDSSAASILAAVTQAVRRAGGSRSTYVVAENEPQQTRLVRPQAEGGYGMDALWNDDFHHSAQVRLSGHNEAYYTDYRGTAQEFVSALKWGYLYQGQRYAWQLKRRGTPTFGVPASCLVNYIENHDQVANSAQGQRAHAVSAPGAYRAMSAVLVLGPATPMLFQGQEFAASSPFFYFADHEPALAELVCEGRRKFLSQFRSIATDEVRACLPDPADPSTFERCKLDFSERLTHAAAYALYADLLKLRREDPVLNPKAGARLDGAVLGPGTFVMRFFGPPAYDRLFIVNFDDDLFYNPAPEPLLAPPPDRVWRILWSSENIRYGGNGTPEFETEEGWRILGRAAVVLAAAVPD